MANLNRVFLIGNLTRDPEVRYTPKGTAVGDLSMAVNTSIRGQDGQVKEETCFVDVVAWGRQAETAKEFLQRGSPVFVEGRLQFEQWETREGEKRNRLRVRAERIQFLGRGKSAGSPPSGEEQGRPREAGELSRSLEENVPDGDDVPF
ncbi:Single-stranded DNA-binding protein [Methylacidimicrobium cyclopophantes]|uniref:Single-stranded DNA-binding protein n=1 Tax=Methylacidimicrobium cyclopophantes TaxID=1041766 RepID=A0A5E6M6J8_9BACT|nr:single-stranded DNA-binding protein [Methylacidimicrobium cyclopophantes]VVM04560.1 Single-stranded DNA-binding protein [Methylacidimicrobium cyclopophantes]